MNLQSETSEFMDQPSVQRDGVVTIPPAPDDSSIASASAAAKGQPRFLAAMSASAANTQGQSRAPRQQRSRWNNLCSWLTFDILSPIIQTLVLYFFVPIFRDEPAHSAMQSWVTGTGLGCVFNRSCRRFWKQSHRAVSVSPGSEVGESQSGRLHRFGIQVLKWLWRLLDVFFELWLGVAGGILYTHWITRQAPHLSWLSKIFLVIALCHYLLPLMLVVFILML